MAVSFATNADVKARWPSFPIGEENYADTLCADASGDIRDRWPDIDARIASEAIAAGTVTRIVARMVKRAMKNDTDGVQQESTTTGPFSESRTYANPEGNLYFTDSEIAVLSGRSTPRAFAVDLSSNTRPDWLD